MRAFLEDHPWRDTIDLRLGERVGKYFVYASGVDTSGDIVWTQGDDGTQVPVFLRLRRDVVEALAKALGEHIPEADATVAALKDTRQVRDRLLALVESSYPPRGAA